MTNFPEMIRTATRAAAASTVGMMIWAAMMTAPTTVIHLVVTSRRMGRVFRMIKAMIATMGVTSAGALLAALTPGRDMCGHISRLTTLSTTVQRAPTRARTRAARGRSGMEAPTTRVPLATSIFRARTRLRARTARWPAARRRLSCTEGKACTGMGRNKSLAEEIKGWNRLSTDVDVCISCVK